MIQLTYTSSSTAAVGDGEVETILTVSRRNNSSAGVTGLLLYNGRRFLQALEGDDEAVETIFERIKCDPRHRALVLLSSHNIIERAFGTWAMAARRVTNDTDSEDLQRQVGALTEGLGDRALHAHFRRYAEIPPALRVEAAAR